MSRQLVGIISSVIEIQIGRLAGLKNAIEEWTKDETSRIQAYHDALEIGEKVDEWLVDEYIDDQKSIKQMTRTAFGTLPVCIASCVEHNMWMICRYATNEIKPDKKGRSPLWGQMKEGLEKWIGAPFAFCNVPGFKDGANRARILANCFKHNSGRKNEEDVKTFGENEEEEIAYEKEDIDRLISKAKEFLISLLNEVAKKKGDSAYA